MTSRSKMALALQPEADAYLLIDQAARWAERLGHTLDLVSVSDPRVSVDPILGANVADVAAVEQMERDRDVLDWLGDMLRRVPEGCRGRVALLSGPIGPTLVQASEAVDLLAVGTHHRSATARLFMGSISEAVVRDAKCPVLVLTQGSPPIPSDGPLKVHLPVDPSDPNTHAIEWLATHLPTADATAVYALPWLRVFGPSPTSGHAMYDAADQALAGVLHREGHHNLNHLVLVRQEMSAGDALAHEASDVGAHLIALPTHGRSGLIRAVIGSVAERTVRAADVAVLVVR